MSSIIWSYFFFIWLYINSRVEYIRWRKILISPQAKFTQKRKLKSKQENTENIGKYKLHFIKWSSVFQKRKKIKGSSRLIQKTFVFGFHPFYNIFFCIENVLQLDLDLESSFYLWFRLFPSLMVFELGIFLTLPFCDTICRLSYQHLVYVESHMQLRKYT